MMDYIKYGIIKALRLKKVVFLIYLVQLLIAIPLGLQVYQVIEASIGNSLSMNIIESGFDRTVFEDFLNIHGASITPLIGTLRYIIPTYLAISIFLHAGIIGNILNGESSIPSFLLNGWKYFKSFLGINLAMMTVSLVWSILIWIPYLIFLGNPVEDHSSEKVFVISVIITGIVYVGGIIFIWIWSLNTKFRKVVAKESIKSSLRSGWQLSKLSGKHQLTLFMIFVVIHFVTIAIYFVVSNPIGASSLMLIIILTILQQLFSIFRIGLRVSLYSTLLKSASLNNRI